MRTPKTRDTSVPRPPRKPAPPRPEAMAAQVGMLETAGARAPTPVVGPPVSPSVPVLLPVVLSPVPFVVLSPGVGGVTFLMVAAAQGGTFTDAGVPPAPTFISVTMQT